MKHFCSKTFTNLSMLESKLHHTYIQLRCLHLLKHIIHPRSFYHGALFARAWYDNNISIWHPQNTFACDGRNGRLLALLGPAPTPKTQNVRFFFFSFKYTQTTTAPGKTACDVGKRICIPFQVRVVDVWRDNRGRVSFVYHDFLLVSVSLGKCAHFIFYHGKRQRQETKTLYVNNKTKRSVPIFKWQSDLKLTFSLTFSVPHTFWIVK